jgi:stage II sporulation protein D
LRKKFIKIVCFVIFILIVEKCFEIVFLGESINTSSNEDEEEELIVAYKEYNYGDYSKIKLLHTENQEVEEMELDKYLYGVVSAEMPASFENEALKAQAVVARTYTIYQIRNSNKHEDVEADICDSSYCCQAWMSKENRMARWEKKNQEEYLAKIENAVNSTIGKVILYENEPIDAFFHSNSGGVTESEKYVWGSDLPYLESVQTARRRGIFILFI